MTSPDFWHGHDLLAGCCGSLVKAWNPLSPAPHVHTFDPQSAVRTVQWNANSKVLAFGGATGVVALYNESKFLGALPSREAGAGGMGPVNSLRFSKNSKLLAVGCQDSLLHVWDLKHQILIARCSEHKGSVLSVAISPEDEKIASSGADGVVLLHSLHSGECLAKLSSEVAQCKRSLTFCWLDPSLMAAAADDGSIIIWNTNHYNRHLCLHGQHEGGATGVCFSPVNVDLFYSCGMDQQIIAWDTRTEQEVLRYKHSSAFTSLAARDDGNWIGAGTNDGALMVFDVRFLQQPHSQLRFALREPVEEIQWQRSISSAQRAQLIAKANEDRSDVLQRRTERLKQHELGSSDSSKQSSRSSISLSGGNNEGTALSPAHSVEQTRTTPVSHLSWTLSNNSLSQPHFTTPDSLSSSSSNPAMMVTPGIALNPSTTGAPGRISDDNPMKRPNQQNLSASHPKTTRETSTKVAAAFRGKGNDSSQSGARLSGGQEILQQQPARRSSLRKSGTVGKSDVEGTKKPDVLLPSVSDRVQGTKIGETLPKLGDQKPTSSETSVHTRLQQSNQIGLGTLSEPIFKAYIDEVADGLREDLTNLHIDVIRQFHVQQVETAHMMEAMQNRQEELIERVTDLQRELCHLQGQTLSKCWL